MACSEETLKKGGDTLELLEDNPQFADSPTSWLVLQGIKYLNTAGKEGELGYKRTVDLLLKCGEEVLETVTEMFHKAKNGDSPFRWCLLYVLGDAGNEKSAKFLVHTALKQLPETNPDGCCEGSRDAEMLISTMAIHSLYKVAIRFPEVSEHVLKIISEKPAQPLYIEAIKVARQLKLEDKVQEILPKEDRWILDIKQAHTKELFADPEREEVQEKKFNPPRKGSDNLAPRIICKKKMEG